MLETETVLVRIVFYSPLTPSPFPYTSNGITCDDSNVEFYVFEQMSKMCAIVVFDSRSPMHVRLVGKSLSRVYTLPNLHVSENLDIL